MPEFRDIARISLDEAEVLRRAKSNQRYINRRFGPGSLSIQESVDSVIDAQMEYEQGSPR